MNLFLDGIAWILDPANWTGPGSIPVRIAQHLHLNVPRITDVSFHVERIVAERRACFGCRGAERCLDLGRIPNELDPAATR